ncbi:hypothetical protein GWK47_002606 [Chionoecetes opilio]|uniref:Uncharacterized protein n=1 Tax=Chionoecetes opilio TaxID=41210 RepID=A0A8J4XLL3_CHIOP|nr:hypothetical protein GWK47_002606 [Chionoecetes opilio]
MAPHHEVAAAGPARRLADKEKPAKTESGGDAGGAQHAVNLSVQVGVSAERLRDMPLLWPEGHFLAPVSGPHPPGRRSSAHPSLGTSPLPPCSDRWRVEMAASLPVVISCSRPRATCPYTAWRTLGRKCLWRVAYCWGTSAYPNVTPGYTHGSHPRCRGQHATPGNHHLSGLRGDCLHHRVHLHS